MPEVSIDIEIYCSCGQGLCSQSTGGSGRYGPNITVEPCEKCVDESYERGVEDGWEKAQDEREEL